MSERRAAERTKLSHVSQPRVQWGTSLNPNVTVASIKIRSMGEIAIHGEMSPEPDLQLEDFRGDLKSPHGRDIESHELSLYDATPRRSYSEVGGKTSPSGYRPNSFPVFQRSLSEVSHWEPHRRVKSNSSSSDSVLYSSEFTRMSPPRQAVHALEYPFLPVFLEPPRAHGFQGPRDGGLLCRNSLEDLPENLSQRRRSQSPPDYPPELQLGFGSHAEGVVECVELRARQGRECQQGGRGGKRDGRRGGPGKGGASRGVKRELDAGPSGSPVTKSGKTLGKLISANHANSFKSF